MAFASLWPGRVVLNDAFNKLNQRERARPRFLCTAYRLVLAGQALAGSIFTVRKHLGTCRPRQLCVSSNAGQLYITQVSTKDIFPQASRNRAVPTPYCDGTELAAPLDFLLYLSPATVFQCFIFYGRSSSQKCIHGVKSAILFSVRAAFVVVFC